MPPAPTLGMLRPTRPTGELLLARFGTRMPTGIPLAKFDGLGTGLTCPFFVAEPI